MSYPFTTALFVRIVDAETQKYVFTFISSMASPDHALMVTAKAVKYILDERPDAKLDVYIEEHSHLKNKEDFAETMVCIKYKDVKKLEGYIDNPAKYLASMDELKKADIPGLLNMIEKHEGRFHVFMADMLKHFTEKTTAPCSESESQH